MPPSLYCSRSMPFNFTLFKYSILLTPGPTLSTNWSFEFQIVCFYISFRGTDFIELRFRPITELFTRLFLIFRFMLTQVARFDPKFPPTNFEFHHVVL